MKRLNRLKPFKLNDINIYPHTKNLPIVTVTGTKEVLIESSYILLQYKENDIRLQCGEHMVQIIGDKLMISFMYPDELMLVGIVKQIMYHRQ